jgi:hypothetical protein
MPKVEIFGLIPQVPLFMFITQIQTLRNGFRQQVQKAQRVTPESQEDQLVPPDQPEPPAPRESLV